VRKLSVSISLGRANNGNPTAVAAAKVEALEMKSRREAVALSSFKIRQF